MWFFFGIKTMTIKDDVDHQNHCEECRSTNLQTTITKDYFHIWFIPMFALGKKSISIRCNECKYYLRDKNVQKLYLQMTRTPFYMYTGLIIFMLLVCSLVVLNITSQHKKHKYVLDPQVEDVYTIREENEGNTIYYFLRIKDIRGDTVLMYHSNLYYKRFISQMERGDYFDKSEELIFTKSQLREMMDESEINNISRDYSSSSGFNVIK